MVIVVLPRTCLLVPGAPQSIATRSKKVTMSNFSIVFSCCELSVVTVVRWHPLERFGGVAGTIASLIVLLSLSIDGCEPELVCAVLLS